MNAHKIGSNQTNQSRWGRRNPSAMQLPLFCRGVKKLSFLPSFYVWQTKNNANSHRKYLCCYEITIFFLSNVKITKHVVYNDCYARRYEVICKIQFLVYHSWRHYFIFQFWTSSRSRTYTYFNVPIHVFSANTTAHLCHKNKQKIYLWTKMIYWIDDW